MQKKLFFLIILVSFQLSQAQKFKLKVYTNDIDNFWITFDSLQKTNNKEEQLKIIQQLYLDKATQGLKDFIISREDSITQKYWNNIHYIH